MFDCITLHRWILLPDCQCCMSPKTDPRCAFVAGTRADVELIVVVVTLQTVVQRVCSIDNCDQVQNAVSLDIEKDLGRWCQHLSETALFV